MARQRGAFTVEPAMDPHDKLGPRKGFKVLDDMLSAEGPIAEDEQEAIVRQFERMQLSAARTWRTAFGSGAVLLAGFFAWAAWQQFSHPWGQRITGELRAAGADADAMTVAFAFQAVAMVLCAWATLQLPPKDSPERGCMPATRKEKLLMSSSLLLSIACCTYWLSVHYDMVARYGKKHGSRQELLWVPLAPPAYAALCTWVLSSLGSVGRDVEDLKKHQYNLHSA